MYNFTAYKKLPKSVQSLATQHFLLEWLFSLNDKQEKTLNLMQRLRALRIKIIEDAHISTTARFSPSPLKLLTYLDSEINSRYWRVKLKGKPIVSKFKFSRLMQLTNYQPIYTDKAFFILLSQPNTASQNLAPAINALSLHIKDMLLSKQARKHWHLPATAADELSTIINRKYAWHIDELCNTYTLDSLTALLIIAIYQQNELQEARPTHAEKCAFELFIKLFAIKYCPSNTPKIGFGIAQLLIALSAHSNEQEKEFVTPTVKHFDHLLGSLSETNITLKRDFKFDQKVLDESLLNFDDSKYLNQKELGFLIK